MIKCLKITAAVCATALSMSIASADQHMSQQQPTAPIETTKNFNASQVTDIHNIIVNYMLTHPEILNRTVIALRAKIAKQQNEKALVKIQENKKDIFNNQWTPVIGNPKGKITIVEFFDYQCHHCKTSSNIIRQQLKNNKNLRVAIKDFAMFGDYSVLAAKVSLYAKQEGKYKAFHNALIDHKGQLDQDTIYDLAKKVGLNQKKLEEYLHKNANDLELYMVNTRDIAEKLGIDRTPAFIIANTDNNKYVFKKGAIDEKALKDAISQVQ